MAGIYSTPLLPVVLTLQFSEPPWHGRCLFDAGKPVANALFPFVTSLKTQPAASVALEVQLAPAFFAKAYSTNSHSPGICSSMGGLDTGYKRHNARKCRCRCRGPTDNPKNRESRCWRLDPSPRSRNGLVALA